MTYDINTNFNAEDFRWTLGGDPEDIEAVANTEAAVFGDGCARVAEGVVWDYLSGSYRGVTEARFFEYATYIRPPAYDATVW